jgi:hypothetical protein
MCCNADSNETATSKLAGLRHSARCLRRSHRVAMRSLAERANLLATPSGFWKRELLSQTNRGVSVAPPFAHGPRSLTSDGQPGSIRDGKPGVQKKWKGGDLRYRGKLRAFSIHP